MAEEEYRAVLFFFFFKQFLSILDDYSTFA